MSLRMLVVDDDDSVRHALRDYFQAAGYDVDAAQEVEEAEALLANFEYQVVLTDMRLTGAHGAEGLEIIGYVRDQCPWTRVVLLTGHASAELEAEVHRRGADALFHKPKPLPEIEQVLRTMAGSPQ